MPHPVLERVEAALTRHFGQPPARASVSFVGVEPIDVLRFEPVAGERAYVTLGMSRHPMTAADDLDVAADGPRAELMFQLRDPTGETSDVWRRLALLGAAPAVEGVVYSPGMSADLGEALTAASSCTGVVVAESAIADVATPQGPVTVLQVLPATSAELGWCRVRGSAALRERWAAAGTDLLDLARSGVSLG